VNTGGRHDERHDQCGRETVGRHVAEHDANASPSQPAEGVEIATDRVGGQASRGNFGISLKHGRRREQFQLKIVGQLQLTLEPLLLQIALNQPGILHRCANLIGHCAHQLTIIQREAIPPDPIGQIDNAYATKLAARRGITDGDADEGLPAIAPVIAAVRRRRDRVDRIEGDDALFAKDAGRDRALIVHLYGPQPFGIEAAGADCAQRPTGFVVHHDRGTAGADYGADLARDDLSGLLQPHGTAQNLADRIEKIDLLVAPGQLLGHSRPLPFDFQQRTENRSDAGSGTLQVIGLLARNLHP
jgi:hypothetical protein